MELEAGLQLILGPSGGGKSRWAEHLAASSGLPVVYLATGPRLPHDPDWQRKLEEHRCRRPMLWSCLEVEGDLEPALRGVLPGSMTLVDSLGTWVAAWLEEEPSDWDQRCDALLGSVSSFNGPLLLVAEEVGWSVVPATAAGSRFRHRLTALLLRLQPLARRTWLVVADRALDLDRLGVLVPQAPVPTA